MSEYLTFLVTTLPASRPGSGAPRPDEEASAPAVFDEVVTRHAGHALPADGWGPTRIAAFPVAHDAATVAVWLTERAGAPTALYRGDARRSGERYTGPALDAARALHRLAGDGIVLTAAAAGIVSPLLPPDATLADLGSHVLAPRRPERVFEVHVPGTGVDERDDAGAANLVWAWRWAPAAVVGRDEALAALEREWERACTGECRLVVLTGEAGIGKTTLAAELALRVHAADAQVLYGRWDEDRVTDYDGLREALDAYAARCPVFVLRRDLVGHVDTIARLLPGVVPRLGGVRAPGAADAESVRSRLFEAIPAWLARIAARRPVLVVLDDLHWAERASLGLLRHLLAHLAAPVLIVATARPGQTTGIGAETAEDAAWAEGAVSVPLDGLTPDDVETLVMSTLGRPVAHDESATVAHLSEETAGNPLYLAELLHHLGDDPAALRGMRDRLPAQVHDVVRWRLEALPPAAVDALEAASVIGERFAAEVAAGVVARDPVAVHADLDLARRAGILHELTGDTYELAFSHGVVRRALLDGVASERRRDLHGRVAVALAERAGTAGSSAAEVARHHLIAGRDVAEAVLWARRAADQARRETAYETAVDLLSRAVALDDRRGDDPALRCELRLELAEAHDRAGGYTDRDARHVEAAERADALGRDDLFAQAALGYGGRLPAAALPNATARRLLTGALDRLPADDSRPRALALARLAQVQHNDVPYAERRRLSDEAVDMARRLNIPTVLAEALMARHLALDGPDDVDLGLGTGHEVMRIATRIGDTDIELQGARALLPSLLTKGDVAEAHELADRFATLAARNLHPDHLRILAMWRTLWAGVEGRWHDFDVGAADLAAQLTLAGHPQVDVISWGQHFPVRWLRGRLDEGRRFIDDIYSISPTFALGQALVAAIDATTGDLDNVRRLVAEGALRDLGAVDHGFLWLPTVLGAAIAAATLRDAAWADHIASILRPYERRHCVMGYTAYMGHARHHLGALAWAAGRVDEAATQLERALEEHERVGARPFAALSARVLSEVLGARDGPGDADRAGTVLRRSDELAAALDLRGAPFTS